MKGKVSNIFWGLVLILISGLLLTRSLGILSFEIFSEQIWIWVFAVSSVAFFLSYFLDGIHKWGWLFPALICAALALTLAMATSGLEGSFLGVPILASIALPFYIGFAMERNRWGLLIPAFVLTVISVITLIAETVRGEWIGALVLFSIGLPFLVVFLRDRKKRWALIPGFILSALAVITLISSFANGDWIGALVLYAIAVPFMVIYFFDRSKRWPLIPASVLGIIGTIPLLSAITNGDLSGALVMFLFALPFFVIYFMSKDHWWALIPAGVFASIGLVGLLDLFFPTVGENISGLFTGVLFLGFGATFGALWLRRATQPTDWAKYPAVGLFTAALLAVILGNRFQDFWPGMILLGIGIFMIFNPFRRKRSADSQQTPDNK